MRFIILGHRQDRDHRDRTLAACLSSCALVHRRKVGIQIAGITASAGHLLARSGNLTQRLSIVCNVGHNDQHVHIALKRQILCGSQCHTGRGNTLDRGVGGEVDEHYGTVDRTGLLEVGNKEVCFLIGNTDRGEHHRKLLILAAHLCLTRDLCGEICVGQTRAGEDRQLLSAHQGIQTVNGGDTRLNKLGRIESCGGIDGRAVDIQGLCGNNGSTAVDGLAHAAENATEHILGNGKLYAVTGKTHTAVCKVKTCGGIEQLYKHVAAVDLKHAAASDLAVRQLDLAQLVKLDAVHLLDKHQRSCDLFYGSVFANHTISSLSNAAI